MLRNFRDGLIQVTGLKWKHYSMSWHLSLEVGCWLGARLGQEADTRLVLTSDTASPCISLVHTLPKYETSTSPITLMETLWARAYFKSGLPASKIKSLVFVIWLPFFSVLELTNGTVLKLNFLGLMSFCDG